MYLDKYDGSINQHKEKDMAMKDMMNQVNYDSNRMLSRKEAAEFLGVSEVTLAIWKSTKRYSLPVVKVGRLARYRFSDLLDFIDRRTVNRPPFQESNKR